MTLRWTGITKFAMAIAAAGLIALPVAPIGVPAYADSGRDDQGASIDISGGEWRQRFDPSSRSMNFSLQSASPTLGDQSIASIQSALARYQSIAARGGWGTVSDGEFLRIGLSNQRVVELRQRLIASGDLEQNAGMSQTFDSYVDAAVRRFQSRHGILPDGVVRGETLEQLNVPVETRISQLSLNLARVQGLSENISNRYVLVNIPGAEVEAVENGVVASRHTAVVGKIDRPSPLLSSAVHQINFNPFWHAPASIVRRDIIPKMQEDPEYLANFRIRIYDQRGNEIDPSQVNWNSDEAESYLLRQDPGDFNAMGAIKINFHNKHSVYLHDTPETTLFGTNARFHSSGCVRVQNVRELVTWLLNADGDWSRSRVDAVIRSGERIDANIRNRTPIHFAYITAWATTDGVVHFRPDIYNKDAASDLAISGSDT